ncbi:hypothetical protein [Roseovarius phycicola]|uniref:50S ribosomal protein L35 n=1 Tax=Roseovarius phycicola TaxID=3080976 RepID=A0ABZ2HLY4_9RHOB
MDPDLIFTLGVVLGVFSLPAMFSAFSERRAPRVAAFTVILAGIMILWAVRENPGRYSFWGIPDTFVEVVAKYLT